MDIVRFESHVRAHLHERNPTLGNETSHESGRDPESSGERGDVPEGDGCVLIRVR